MTATRSIDHGKRAKQGFLLGVGLLALGAAGEIIGHLVFGTLPGWENTLFTYSEGIGILIGFFSVWVFGVMLPLME
jgi:hypothetical protein